MKKVVLHHTCSPKGGETYVLQNAPFFAKDNPQNMKYQFLGGGYYLWEDDIEQAKYWGKIHYRNVFLIVEFECYLQEEYLLNLNEREGQKKFKEIIQILQTKINQNNRNTKIEQDWTLSRIIKFLYSGKSGILFDYKAIKVKDVFSSNRRQLEIKFTSYKPNYTYIDSIYFYYFHNKEDMNIISKKIVR